MARFSNSPLRLGCVAAALLTASTASAAAAAAPVNQRQCSWGGHSYPTFAQSRSNGQRTCPRIVNGESDDFAPWSHAPHCVEAAMEDLGAPEWCVFTDSAFRGGQGLSVMTQAHVAANMVGAGILDDTSAYLADQAHAAASGEDATFVLKEFRNRGKGAVARRALGKWETVMRDYPVVMAKGDFFSTLEPEEQAELKKVAMEQLPEKTQELVYSLAHSKGLELVEDILRTNILGIDVCGETHFGLYPWNSRVNHHCKPNTYWRYIPSTLASEIVALGSIRSGDEIYHSYIPLGLPRLDRQQALSLGWNFNCSCSLCSLPKDKALAHEMRRMRLHEMYQAMVDPQPDAPLSGPVIRAHVRELHLIMQQEDLHLQLCDYYQVVARAFAAVELFDEAREYADKAEEYWIRYGTEEHENVEGVKELAAEIDLAERLYLMGPKPRSWYHDDDELGDGDLSHL